MDAQVRLPPHSIEAEQSVLGSLMLSPKAWDSVSETLREEDFYRRDHQLIYRAIASLAERGKPFDVITMGEYFQTQGIADQVGGVSYVLELGSTQASAVNVRAYADIVANKALLRRIIDGCTAVMALAFQPGEKKADQIIDGAIGGLMKLLKHNAQAEWSVQEALKQAFESMVKASEASGIPGIPTGLTKLDENFGGFHDSDLIVIGGRPSMGKTAMLLGNCVAGAEVGPVGLISGEQAAAQMAARLLSLKSGVVASKMRNGSMSEDDWARLTTAVAGCRELPIHILDRSAPTLSEVIRVARRWKREKGIRALYLDYLQRVEAPGEKAHERVAAVAKGLKTLARDLNIPVIALAQVKREVETRTDKRPRMGDLCDSSEIEKEADTIALIYRDDYYHPDSPDKGTAEIIVDKNRHGETGFVRVAWHAPTMRFGDLDPSWQHDRNATVPQDHSKHDGRQRKARSISTRGKDAAAGDL